MNAENYSPDVRSRTVLGNIAEAPSAPMDFPNRIWKCAKGISKTLKDNHVKSQVLRGNGSTSPAGSEKATNYFTIEKNDRTNKLYYNFDMNEANAEKIVKVLKQFYIPFTWSGGLASCITFVVDQEGNPE